MAIYILNTDYKMIPISSSETKIHKMGDIFCARCKCYCDKFKIPADYANDIFPPPESYHSSYKCMCPEDPNVTYTCILILVSGKY